MNTHKITRHLFAGVLIIASGCGCEADNTGRTPPKEDTPIVTENQNAPTPGPLHEHVGRKPIPSADALKALPADGGPEFNRLVFEKSPYLLQHASNPVDWHPWGQEAFEKAKRENKPIFLSVGYSTCHWCHVMERESFEMRSVGEVLNKYFVAVKVDREERPDVDRVYMTYVQATSGRGGWPMSVWLTPDLKPFYAGTYFPPDDAYGRPGFKSVLLQLAKAWEEQRDKLQASGDEAIKQLKRMSAPGDDPDLELQKSILKRGYEQIMSSYDPRYGGFGNAPKFPRPVVPSYVLRHSYRHGDDVGRDAVLHTLHKMADGGMHDHVGNGFARYSVDDRWHVPHFEKMLYDQGQLVPLYLDAYQITRDTFFADIARGILRYVQRDMTGDQGQFYSAEDADSPLPENPTEQAEGAFYVWEKGQIDAALGDEDAKIFNMIFDVNAGGNVRSDPHHEFHNKNVLIIEHSIEDAAATFNRSPEDVRDLVDASLETLFHIREKRPRPHLDDKTITAWNGLMISAFAQAYTVLGDESHLASAQKATAFIREHLYDEKDHTLQRRFRAGESAIEGYVDDYAFFIQGLLDLYDATFDTDYIAWAAHLQDTQDRLFWDDKDGGYFSTSGDDATILLRMKETYDGAEPSPNSIAAINLLRLAQYLGDEPYLAKAQKTFLHMGSQLKSTPSATPKMMSALDFFLHKPKQVVIAGPADAEDTKAMLAAARADFIPNRIIILADGGANQAFLARKQEFLKDVKPLDGKATAYVCENYVCQLPTSDVKVMMQQLAGSTASK